MFTVGKDIILFDSVTAMTKLILPSAQQPPARAGSDAVYGKKLFFPNSGHCFQLHILLCSAIVVRPALPL